MVLAMPASAAQSTTVPATGATPGAPAPSGGTPRTPLPVDIVEVTGRIDRIQASFILRSIGAAARHGSQLLVVQLDSPGAIASSERLDDLAAQVRGGPVPVAVWVGPGGSVAYGESVRLLRAAAVSGMANGAHLGRFRGPCPECRPGDPLVGGRRLSASDAQGLKAVDLVTPTLGDFIVELDGREVGGRVLDTAEVVQRDGQPRREPIVQVRFAKLNLVERVLHGTTNPAIAYTLLVIGLLLMVFEFFSVGIGLAGLTGAVSLALSAYGLAALGAHPIGIALVLLAAFGFAVDVQAGTPRVWTAIGAGSLALGSWWLFPADRRVKWWAAVLVLAGTVVFVIRGMTTMVRTRFSTATIGREPMVGESAEAASAIDPEGTVRLRGALWRARARPVATIGVGRGVRVVAIDGLVLEVEANDREPEAGNSGGG